MEQAYIGVDVGGMSIKAGVVDLNGKIIKKSCNHNKYKKW